MCRLFGAKSFFEGKRRQLRKLWVVKPVHGHGPGRYRQMPQLQFDFRLAPFMPALMSALGADWSRVLLLRPCVGHRFQHGSRPGIMTMAHPYLLRPCREHDGWRGQYILSLKIFHAIFCPLKTRLSDFSVMCKIPAIARYRGFSRGIPQFLLREVTERLKSLLWSLKVTRLLGGRPNMHTCLKILTAYTSSSWIRGQRQLVS